VFDLRCADARRGRELLGNVEADYYTQILPVIEEVFDGFSEDEISLEIDRLEIDLGDAEDARFEQELPERIARALRQRLSEIIAGNDQGLTVRRQPSAQSDWEAVCNFLQTGQAPWWVGEKAFAPWELVLEIADAQPARLRSFLGGLLTTDGNATMARRVMERIAGSSSAAVLPTIQGLLLPQDFDVVESIWNIVSRLSREIGMRESDLWQLKTALLLAAAVTGKLNMQLFELWERHSAQSKLWANLLEYYQNGWLDTKHIQPWTDWLAQKADFTGQQQKVKESGFGADTIPEDQAAKRAFDDSVLLGEEFFVSNAGLVLVAGFLPSYFGALDLLQGDGFRDLPAQMRAVQMLDVLARGLHPAAEHELLLNKVVCGIEIQSALDLTSGPNQEDLAAADALLSAVIGYWPVVGDITPDQLRGGFLLRDGWLRKGAQDWTLRVERKTYDVVLERLPWSIGVVMLPWMDAKIWVEW
jgi:hypothetical protein